MSKEDLKNALQQSKTRHGLNRDEIITTVQVKQAETTEEFVVHSVQIKMQKLEWLRNYVHQEREKGKYYFRHMDALDEAIDLLMAKVGNVPDRPDFIKKKERKKTGRKPKNQAAPTTRNDLDPFA